MDTSDQMLADRMHEAGGTIPLPPGDPADDVRRGRARLRRRRAVVLAGAAVAVTAVVGGVTVLEPGGAGTGGSDPASATAPPMAPAATASRTTPGQGDRGAEQRDDALEVPPSVRQVAAEYREVLERRFGDLRVPAGGLSFFQPDIETGADGRSRVVEHPSQVLLETRNGAGVGVNVNISGQYVDETGPVDAADPAGFEADFRDCVGIWNGPDLTCKLVERAGAVRAGVRRGDGYLGVSVITDNRVRVTVGVRVPPDTAVPYDEGQLFSAALDPVFRLP